MDRSAPWTVVAVAVLLAMLPTAATQAARLRTPPAAPGTVLLVGEVDVGGTHSGMIELLLDGELQARVPAGQGAFQIELPATGAAGMVSLEYLAPGVRLRSLLGGQQRLAWLAGRDGRLTAQDADGLRVTPLATAVAVLATTVDGVPPATDADLAEAIRAAWGSDLQVVATALERLAVDPGRLPAGFPDGLSLVADVAAFNAALRADPGLAASPQLVFDPMPVSSVGLADTRPVLALAGPHGAPGTPLESNGALLMEPHGQGDVLLHGMDDRPQLYAPRPEMSGTIQLLPLQSVPTWVGYAPCRGDEKATGMLVATVLGRDLRRHWRGQGVSLWQIGTDVVYEQPDCPDPQPWQERRIELWAAPGIPRTRSHDAPAMLVGRHALPMVCGVDYPHHLVVEACGRADHVLARGGSGTAYPVGEAPVALTWGRDASGAIRFAYADGRVSRQWLIDAGDGVVQTVAWVAEAVIDGYTATGSGHATRIRGAGMKAGRRAAAPVPAGPRHGAGAP
ncbi:hypothetical protein [Luteimonas sp. MC1750]|uniref:hypothetical protein n=1 Tax=Luteimonas sp. MC1750 TaxID=2799326 RepID=UPI0018F0BDD7|nr:hypothetical protein [Luteimonas sp. MC1750]MBJ6985326.1 hypothetical protein [Luteimonas sp. MC1750]QQO05412.1 hypothetical protein JGR68_11295 [Luteimonas sp. MC1750]